MYQSTYIHISDILHHVMYQSAYINISDRLRHCMRRITLILIHSQVNVAAMQLRHYFTRRYPIPNGKMKPPVLTNREHCPRIIQNFGQNADILDNKNTWIHQREHGCFDRCLVRAWWTRGHAGKKVTVFSFYRGPAMWHNLGYVREQRVE